MPRIADADRDQEIRDVFAATGSKNEVRRQTGAGWSAIQRVLGSESADVSPRGDIAGVIDYERLAATIIRQGGPRTLPAIPDAKPPKAPRKVATPVKVEVDPAPPVEVDPRLAAKLVPALKKRPMDLDEIAARLDVGRDVAAEWVEESRAAGLNLHQFGDCWSVEAGKPTGQPDAPMLEIVSDPDGTFTIGAMGDTHLGSKYERLDVLNSLYDRYAEEGIRDVFHAGNWIEGEARFNKHDISIFGMQNQLNYLAQNYPKRPGIHTYAVAGDDHEGWYGQREGVDIGLMAEQTMRRFNRPDWTDLGYMEAYIKLTHAKSGKSAILALVHPGGGSAYALSYTVQKIVESYSGGTKPAVLFAGHYHKMELVNIRNVWCVQTGCTQDQTPFMRKKRLEAHVGGHIIRLNQDERTGAILELNGMLRYFDVGYYNRRWSHAGQVVLPRRTLGGAA